MENSVIVMTGVAWLIGVAMGMGITVFRNRRRSSPDTETVDTKSSVDADSGSEGSSPARAKRFGVRGRIWRRRRHRAEAENGLAPADAPELDLESVVDPFDLAPPQEKIITPEQTTQIMTELFDIPDLTDPAEVRRRIASLIADLGGTLVTPTEEQPFDPRLHESADTVRTAILRRHKTVAHLLAPGLQDASGELIQPAKVMVYVSEEVAD